MARRSAEEAADTRRRILATARRCFEADGFAAVSLDGLAAAAGVTRGAVHHHFGDKRTVFTEVFELVEHELNAAVAGAVSAARAERRDQLDAACRALFDFVRQPAYRQIALTDAPSVLGLAEWHRIDREVGLATMRVGMQARAAAGLLDPRWVDALSLVLFGALTEAAIALALGGTEVTDDEVVEALRLVLEGLVPPPRG
jgi:AcrR family transcriptional regulator